MRCEGSNNVTMNLTHLHKAYHGSNSWIILSKRITANNLDEKPTNQAKAKTEKVKRLFHPLGSVKSLWISVPLSICAPFSIRDLRIFRENLKLKGIYQILILIFTEKTYNFCKACKRAGVADSRRRGLCLCYTIPKAKLTYNKVNEFN